VSHPDFHLDLKLDRDSEVPVGTQLAWKLRGAIAAGWLAPGEQLPGVRELATEAAVNVNTVRAVYGRLADQGVLVAKHGLGTFVSDAPLGDGELRRIAELAADEAARHGVDPRELAAALYARTARPVGTEPEVERRRALRERIAQFEADVAALEQDITELGGELQPLGQPGRRKKARPRILTVEELEAIADELAARAGERRHELALAQQRERESQLEEVQHPHSVQDTPPELIVSGGTWTLRWKA
jgi:DNA-binding transcriptional regulator YhcF (GntR family)